MALKDTDRIFGWLGSLFLLAIIPIKIFRFAGGGVSDLLVGAAPSFLGAAGLFFLLRTGTGRPSRLPLWVTALVVGIVAVALEMAQILPRPGILRYALYTFDLLDIVASLCGLGVAWVVCAAILWRGAGKAEGPCRLGSGGSSPGAGR